MWVSANLAFFLLTAFSVVGAVPSPRCRFGYGDTCKTAESCAEITFPPARRGDCAPCDMSGCADCSYGKGTCDSCKAGYYPMMNTVPCEEVYGPGATGTCTTIESCKKCQDSCGFCTGVGDSKCKDRGLECAPRKVKAAAQARQVEWKGNACMNRIGRYGTGYTGYYDAWIRNGTCMDCRIGYQQISTYIGSSKTMLCQLYTRALDVAANAWKGVDCQDDPTYVLQGWCFMKLSNTVPFGEKSVNIVFSSQCRTANKGVVEKLISSNGGVKVLSGPLTEGVKLDVELISSKKWTWAEAPATDASGACNFSKEYNLSPLSCPHFQLVSYKSCKLSTATLTNGEYVFNSFEKYIPIWKISGDSSSAVLRSVRSCPNSTLTTNLSKAGKIPLAASSSNKDTSYMVKPVGKLCNIVQLMRKSGGQNQFLTVSSDCVKVSWASKASGRSQFKLERACESYMDDFDESTKYSCSYNLYSADD